MKKIHVSERRLRPMANRQSLPPGLKLRGKWLCFPQWMWIMGTNYNQHIFSSFMFIVGDNSHAVFAPTETN